MKTDRIPETNLACIAPLPTELKWVALRQLKVFVPPHTFTPVRKAQYDILNVQPNRRISLPPTPWAYIESKVKFLSESASEENVNLCAAEGLHAYALENSIHGVANQFTRISLGRGAISYWSNMVLDIGGRTVVPFFDPRNSGGLTPVGMQFVFSAMDHRIRRLDIDFRDALLAILRLSPPVNGKRRVEAHFDTGIVLFPYAQMKAMVRETYDIWGLVLQERAKESRRQPKAKKPSAQIEIDFLAPPPARKAS